MATELVWATVETPVVYRHKLYPRINFWFANQKAIAECRTGNDVLHTIKGYYIINRLSNKYHAEVKVYDANSLEECTDATYIGTVHFAYSAEDGWCSDEHKFHLEIAEYLRQSANL